MRVKPRISCFGHGWQLETPAITFYVGSFGECMELLDRCIPDMANRAAREFCTMNRVGYQEMGSA